ncbi:MAG: PQQ-binding-like beta-propeller repeat protein [Acidothermaceae bacterium]
MSRVTVPTALAATVAVLLTSAACTSKQHSASAPTTSTPPTTALSAATSPVPSSAAPSSTVQSGAPSSPGSTAGNQPAAIWPTYHHDAARTGNAGNVPAVSGLKVTATAKLDAAIYASPLVLKDAKGALVIAATENNTLYALRNDGSMVWSRHIGTPVDGGSLPCGNIDPTGITGTPAYDPSSGLIFAVAFLSGHKHELVAVDATTGAIAWTRPIDPPGSVTTVEQQRAALLVSGGRVWVAYGGLDGDCGPYHGYVVGVPTSGPNGAAVIYQVPSSREAGIWTPAGPAADGAGHIYVSVGNGATTDPSAKYDLSDSVIELDPAGKVVSFFAPSTWAKENARDLDLGTTGPVLLPDGKVFVAGKAGNAYLLNQGNLGGLGAKVPSIGLCTAFGGAAYDNGTVYVPCTSGVRSLKVNGNTLTPGWKASPAGSPVVGGGVVLSVDPGAGTLYALDPGSGAVKAKVALGDATTRFATPAFGDDGHAYVGTQNGTLVVVATS